MAGFVAPKIDAESLTTAELAKTIDHSLLQPTLTREDIVRGCAVAARRQVASVCVKPCFVPLARDLLAQTDVKVGTVVGFPHGSSTSRTKAFEAADAVLMGAVEVDMVQNVGELLGDNYEAVRQDVAAVREAIGSDVLLKVILENAYLEPDQIAISCQLAEEGGADYVKTSSGYAATGAKIEDLKLMRASVSDRIGVKAAGGVRDGKSAYEVIAVGVTRIGATATEAILEDFHIRFGR